MAHPRNLNLVYGLSLLANIAGLSYFTLSPDYSPLHYYYRRLELLRSDGGPAGSGANKTFPCTNHLPQRHLGQRGNYWVFYNYLRGSSTPKCNESITYTTHADWTYLDNLLPLLERWRGPISLAVYAPGEDFQEAMSRILHLRECGGTSGDLIKQFVSFHLVFDQGHVPQGVEEDTESPVNCSVVPSGGGGSTYRGRMGLFYPLNLVRNIAREMATTHFLFPSDIELYPSPGLIPAFLSMVRGNNDPSLQGPGPKVFVLPIFELESNLTILPRGKGELVHLLGNGSAIPFHEYVCPECHHIPKAEEWREFQPSGSKLGVFTSVRRHDPFQHWEPFFIGTRAEPGFDERLSWEGKLDKHVQAFALCLLDYQFLILDNAFLVHRPGIKVKVKLKNGEGNKTAQEKQKELIAEVIVPELQKIYGDRPDCSV